MGTKCVICGKPSGGFLYCKKDEDKRTFHLIGGKWIPKNEETLEQKKLYAEIRKQTLNPDEH